MLILKGRRLVALGILMAFTLLYGVAVHGVMKRKGLAYEACDPSKVGRSIETALSTYDFDHISARKPDDSSVDIGYRTLLLSDYWVCRITSDDIGNISSVVRLPPDGR